MAKLLGDTSPRKSSRSKAEEDCAGKLARAEADKDRVIEELREALRSRDDFLAVAAHELRNPLTPILLCVELIRVAHETGDRSKAGAELKRLERLVTHFSSRANVLLEVAQIAAQKFELVPSEFNLSEMVEEIVDDYRPLVARSGLEIITSIQPGIVGFLDQMALSEIVENLLTNAIKYGQGKPIELALTAADGSAQLVVHDKGIGIAAADIGRIFDRFERAVARKTHAGFGVGLWVVRNFVASMGGSITVTSEPGLGSLFTVSLPIGSGEGHGQ